MTGRCPLPDPRRDDTQIQLVDGQLEITHPCGWTICYGSIGSVPARLERDMAEHFGPLDDIECGAVGWDGDVPLVCVRRPTAAHLGEHVTRDGRSFLVRADQIPNLTLPTRDLARHV